MPYVTPVAAISARFEAQLAADATYAGTAVEWDNVELEAPPDPDPRDPVGTLYIREVHRPDGTFGLTYTDDETFGVTAYEVLVSVDSALGSALALAETIRGWFNRYESGGLTCIGPDGAGPGWVNVGRDEELNRHRVVVTIPWRYFEQISGAIAVSDNQILVTQASHGFDNQWVGKSGGSYVLASDTVEAEGFAVSADTNNFKLTVNGPVSWLSHGFSDGPLYHHVSTDGGTQSAEPGPGERFQRVGSAVDSNTIIVRLEPKRA